MGERDIGGAVALVDPDRVALAEGAAAAVLARQAHAIAFGEPGAEGERLGRRPVEAFAVLEHGALAVADSAQRLWDLDVLGNRLPRWAHRLPLVLAARALELAPPRFRP